MKRLLTLGFFISSLLFSSSLLAASWYRVEVMLIAYTDEAMLNAEHWPTQLHTAETLNLNDETLNLNDETLNLNDETLDFNDATLTTETQPEHTEEASTSAEQLAEQYRWWLEPDINQYSALLSNFQFQRLPKAQWLLPLQPLQHLMLEPALKHIQRRDDMKVIWHQAWVEPIQEREKSILHPLNIELEEEDLKIHLSGDFSLSLSRYLHIHSNLNMQHSVRQMTEPDAEAEATPLSTWQPLRAAHIQQNRRMRSSELHYLDHPMLGIMVQIMPIPDKLDDL